MEPKEYFIPIKGYEMIEKMVKKSGNSGYLYLPAEWIGKKVKIVSLEPIEE